MDSLGLGKEDDDHTVTCELEAAEALAELARCSAAHGDHVSGSGQLKRFRQEPVREQKAASCRPSQGQAIAVQLHGKTSTSVASALKIKEPVKNSPSQLGNSSQSDSVGKLNRNLTEDEREARRLRRVLANRESARQTIRRRHAMYLELVRKAADLSEENKSLKKDQELALKEYNSLKVRNEFLKLQMSNVKKADEPIKMQDKPKSSEAEISTSATVCTPDILPNQQCLVPFFPPSSSPSPNIIQLQYVSHSGVLYSPQFSMETINIPSLHQKEENSSGISGSGNPFFVLPVFLLHPFLSHNTTLHSHADTDNRKSATSSTPQCITSLSSDTIFGKDKHQLSSNQNMSMQASTTLLLPEKLSVRSTDSAGHNRNSHEDENYNRHVVSVCEHSSSRSILRQNPEETLSCEKESENVFAATEARRRRKELMKMKNANCRHVGTQSRC